MTHVSEFPFGLARLHRKDRTRIRALHRMRDILCHEYAVILLTKEELFGTLWPPPETGPSPWLGEGECPKWRRIGSAAENLPQSLSHR